MAKARTLKLQTEVDVKGADQLKGLSDRIGGIGKTLANPKVLAAGIAGGIAASQAADFFVGAINNAAEFNDTVGATGVIFGEEMIPQMEDWANKAAQNFGASKREALGAANQIAVMGKTAGLAGEDLVGFGQEMTQLGGDLASMFGGSTTEAIGAVGAALRGESEPIRRYGVLLDDATLRNRAFELGLISTTKNALTPQQRVLAAQAEILAQTGDAQGDFLRTSDGMANSQRELTAQLDNVTTEIGERLLPVALGFVSFVKDVGIPVIRTLVDVLGFIATPIGWAVDALGFIGEAVGGAVGTITGANEEMTASQQEAVAESGRQWEEYQNQIRATTAVVQEEAVKIGQAPRKAIEAELQPIRDAAFQTQVSYAKGLLDGQNQPKVQMEALQQLQEESMSRTAEIAYLQGQLMSQELASGISSDIDVVRAQAEATRLAIVNRLSTLGVDAYNWGNGVSQSMADGINNGYGTVVNAAGDLAAAVRGQIGIESEPRDPRSPLRGITKWGGNIGKTLAEGVLGSLGIVAGATTALGGALVPSMATASVGGGRAGAFGGGDTHIHITVNGNLQATEEGLTNSILRGWNIVRGGEG